MATLSPELRGQLERTVLRAREAAEAGAEKALQQFAVHESKAFSTMSEAEKALRERLRARGRQLGDRDGATKGSRDIGKLKAECAYEQWHRMLFARFLAECNVLIEPESGVPITLDECKELAREQGGDWLALACSFAQRMLPQIFRSDDPVLEVTLPIEYRQTLEELVATLPTKVFVAEDSLGWVYQFWQSKRKKEINESEVKIGADELPAVTQLFTEDYMVLFLLENTLGAWWASKHLERHPELALSAADEDELRRACSLPGHEWTYLRFMKEDGRWTPAAGCYEGWPREAKQITVLDPCMGSGHFLVFALPILTAMRMEDERLSEADAVIAVLRDNLFGLEIDQRCTQIAAFNLALAAWSRISLCSLPFLNVACCGLTIGPSREAWAALAGDDPLRRKGMEELYQVFREAPVLGSLNDPVSVRDDLLKIGFANLRHALGAALDREREPIQHEIAVTAQGLTTATEILAGRFTLVATNVPYLGGYKQAEELATLLTTRFRLSGGNLANALLLRCVDFLADNGTLALVTPLDWMLLGRYEALREFLLPRVAASALAFLGPHAFQMIPGEVVKVGLSAWNRTSSISSRILALDVQGSKRPAQKALGLRAEPVLKGNQSDWMRNPQRRITVEGILAKEYLSSVVRPWQGIKTSDDDRFVRCVWEVGLNGGRWRPLLRAFGREEFSGREHVFLWEEGNGTLRELSILQARDRKRDLQGMPAWGRAGVAVNTAGQIVANVYCGEAFASEVVALTVEPRYQAAVLDYVRSPEFAAALRRLDKRVSITTSTFSQVPFSLERWQVSAAAKYPNGVPRPHSCDPLQWLFSGYPVQTTRPLQVAVARLLGHRWPRQTGFGFPNCPAVGDDGLESHADQDGIVCISPLRGEAAAADRLTRLLADAFGSDWSAAKLNELLAQVGYGGRSVEAWLRDGFFEQHCELFHQRPFIWHIWDGLRDGFSALVNYHRLAGSNGEGRRTLESLIYTYLGREWIDRQRADQTAGVEGADARLAAGLHLKQQLEKILEGEPPFDIFVRWKPLHEQPVGWEPDVNDGVRLNIRPFMTARPLNARGRSACILRSTPKRIAWNKDRGKEPTRPIEDFPWFWGWDETRFDFPGTGKEPDGNRWNDLHYTRAFKLEARKRKGLA